MLTFTIGDIMIPIIVIIILACAISFVIIQIYNFICLKNQFENFKSATYIYIRKKLDHIPKLVNVISRVDNESNQLIEIIKIRNEFDETDSIKSNLDKLHRCNRLFGEIFNINPKLLEDDEVLNLKNEWYDIDASLRENSTQYIACARQYNEMFANIFCLPVIKIFKLEQEDV